MTRWIVALCACAAACSAPPAQLGPHQPPRLVGAVDVGPTDAGQMMDLVLALKRRPGADVDLLLKQQAKQLVGFMTPAQFGAEFGPTVEDYEALAAWLSARGFEIVRREPSRTTLTVRGTVAAVEDAFHTRIRNYTDTHGQFYAPAEEPQFEPLIARSLDIIIGLDDANYWHSHAHPYPDFRAGAQTPPDLITGYGLDKVPQYQGQGETVAILGTGYPPSLKGDVDSYVKKFSLGFDRKSQYAQIFLGGPNRDSDSLAGTEYGENVLDVQMVMGLAPKASIIHILTATNSPGLFGDGFPYIINNVPQAHAVSVSYGICERFAIGETAAFNLLFQQAKAQGQEWFFAAGDSGSDGCEDGTSDPVLSPGWPTTSPYVMGVGGTGISQGTEVAWSYGGGGQSEFTPKPAYQDGIGPYPDDGVRDTPDVAAVADNVAIVVQGSLTSIGGTSAATPMWAAIWSLLDQSQGGGGIRNSHERMYQLGAAGLGFHDITTGNNGYPALPGYDLATGWGSPDLPSLIAHWTN